MKTVVKEDVLHYLDGQGFVIKPGRGDHLSYFSLSEWDRKFRPEGAFELMKWERFGQLSLKSIYKGRTIQYIWKPNPIRQLFSKLEVSAGDNGSLVVTSQSPMLVEKTVSDIHGETLDYLMGIKKYYEIHLLNTGRE